VRIEAPGFRIRRSFETAFSPDGDLLATVGRDVTIWSVSDRKRLRSTRMVSHPSSLAFSPDSAHLLVKSTRGDLHMCATASADPVYHFQSPAHNEGPGPLFVSDDSIVDANWSGEIRLRQLFDGEERVVWRGASQMIVDVSATFGCWACAVSAKHDHPDFAHPDGADLVVVSDFPRLNAFRSLKARWRNLKSIALSPTGQLLAVRQGFGTPLIEVRRIATGEAVASSVCPIGGTGAALAWAPDGATLVLVSDGGFSFRETTTLREVGWLPSEYPSSVAFSPSGRLVALGDWSNGIVAEWPALLSALEQRPSGTSV
jgi:WD40 repeat protein